MLTPVEESEPGTPTEIDTLVTREDRQNFTILAMSRPLGVGHGIFLYRVMHLDGNSFLGDVVLDSVNMAYGDEDSILDRIYEKQTFLNFNNEDLNFKSD